MLCICYVQRVSACPPECAPMPLLWQHLNKYLQFVEVFFPTVEKNASDYDTDGRNWKNNAKLMHTCMHTHTHSHTHTKFSLPGLRPSSRIRSGLQAQNLCENFVIRVSRYSPRSSGAWIWRKNSLNAFGKNWFLKLCKVTRSSKTSLLKKEKKSAAVVNISKKMKNYNFSCIKYTSSITVSVSPIKYIISVPFKTIKYDHLQS